MDTHWSCLLGDNQTFDTNVDGTDASESLIKVVMAMTALKHTLVGRTRAAYDRECQAILDGFDCKGRYRPAASLAREKAGPNPPSTFANGRYKMFASQRAVLRGAVDPSRREELYKYRVVQVHEPGHDDEYQLIPIRPMNKLPTRTAITLYLSFIPLEWLMDPEEACAKPLFRFNLPGTEEWVPVYDERVLWLSAVSTSVSDAAAYFSMAVSEESVSAVDDESPKVTKPAVLFDPEDIRRCHDPHVIKAKVHRKTYSLAEMLGLDVLLTDVPLCFLDDRRKPCTWLYYLITKTHVLRADNFAAWKDGAVKLLSVQALAKAKTLKVCEDPDRRLWAGRANVDESDDQIGLTGAGDVAKGRHFPFRKAVRFIGHHFNTLSISATGDDLNLYPGLAYPDYTAADSLMDGISAPCSLQVYENAPELGTRLYRITKELKSSYFPDIPVWDQKAIVFCKNIQEAKAANDMFKDWLSNPPLDLDMTTPATPFSNAGHLTAICITSANKNYTTALENFLRDQTTAVVFVYRVIRRGWGDGRIRFCASTHTKKKEGLGAWITQALLGRASGMCSRQLVLDSLSVDQRRVLDDPVARDRFNAALDVFLKGQRARVVIPTQEFLALTGSLLCKQGLILTKKVSDCMKMNSVHQRHKLYACDSCELMIAGVVRACPCGVTLHGKEDCVQAHKLTCAKLGIDAIPPVKSITSVVVKDITDTDKEALCDMWKTMWDTNSAKGPPEKTGFAAVKKKLTEAVEQHNADKECSGCHRECYPYLPALSTSAQGRNVERALKYHTLQNVKDTLAEVSLTDASRDSDPPLRVPCDVRRVKGDDGPSFVYAERCRGCQVAPVHSEVREGSFSVEKSLAANRGDRGIHFIPEPLEPEGRVLTSLFSSAELGELSAAVARFGEQVEGRGAEESKGEAMDEVLGFCSAPLRDKFVASRIDPAYLRSPCGKHVLDAGPEPEQRKRARGARRGAGGSPSGSGATSSTEELKARQLFAISENYAVDKYDVEGEADIEDGGGYIYPSVHLELNKQFTEEQIEAFNQHLLKKVREHDESGQPALIERYHAARDSEAERSRPGIALEYDDDMDTGSDVARFQAMHVYGTEAQLKEEIRKTFDGPNSDSEPYDREKHGTQTDFILSFFGGGRRMSVATLASINESAAAMLESGNRYQLTRLVGQGLLRQDGSGRYYRPAGAGRSA